MSEPAPAPPDGLPGPGGEPRLATPADDIRDEARRLAAEVERSGLELRLLGGLAVWLVAPSVRRPPFARPYRDLDFVGRSRQSRAITSFLAERGYQPDRRFNAMHGARRLLFTLPDGRWAIDVLLDEFRMSHRIDFSERLAGPGATIDLADLLLTKLQIWEINHKDLGDAACLLADHPVEPARGDPSVIDERRVIALTSSDWGLGHTVERNLERVAALARSEPPDGAPHDPVRAAERLLADIRRAPKTLAWRTRARLGERVRWYETPEEVAH